MTIENDMKVFLKWASETPFHRVKAAFSPEMTDNEVKAELQTMRNMAKAFEAGDPRAIACFEHMAAGLKGSPDPH